MPWTSVVIVVIIIWENSGFELKSRFYATTCACSTWWVVHRFIPFLVTHPYLRFHLLLTAKSEIRAVYSHMYISIDLSQINFLCAPARARVCVYVLGAHLQSPFHLSNIENFRNNNNGFGYSRTACILRLFPFNLPFLVGPFKVFLHQFIYTCSLYHIVWLLAKGKDVYNTPRRLV